jgi:hypothetical protein
MTFIARQNEKGKKRDKHVNVGTSAGGDTHIRLYPTTSPMLGAPCATHGERWMPTMGIISEKQGEDNISKIEGQRRSRMGHGPTAFEGKTEGAEAQGGEWPKKGWVATDLE